VFSLSIICKRVTGSPNNIVKIGWIYLNEKNTTDVDNFIRVFSKSKNTLENVIWSNPINLDEPRYYYPWKR
jgi:hypothetical protein